MFSPREDVEEGGFARAVGADDSDALAAREVEADILEKRLFGVGFGEVMDLEYIESGGLFDFQVEDGFLAVAADGLHQLGRFNQARHAAGLEAIEALLAAAGLLGTLPGAEAANVFLFLGDEGLLLIVGPLLGKLAVGLEVGIAGIVAAVLLDLAIDHVEDFIDHGIEKIAVVRDHHQRNVGHLVERGFQPVEHRQIEVIRRLIQQHQIRPLEQQPRELGPRFLPARKQLDGHLQIALGKAEFDCSTASTRRAMSYPCM